MKSVFTFIALLGLVACDSLVAQVARVRTVDQVAMPGDVDSNSPAFWRNGPLNWFTSHGGPVLNQGVNQFGPFVANQVTFGAQEACPHWIEAVYVDDDGTMFGWYHAEPIGLFENSTLTAPKIGAVVSYDGGNTLFDLGVVLQTGDALNPNSHNGYFGGGHGDCSVILDQDKKYFYLHFDNYGGANASQGVVVARMAYEDRFSPVGKVFKYNNGAWAEPGLGGAVTPIYPVVKPWQYYQPDAMWGPSVHWNTYLNRYVMLLNHAQGDPGWAQEGVYVSFCSDLSHPESWTTPVKILDKADFPSWYFFYPQVMGLEDGGSDTLAGQTARLYVGGVSRWEIDFFQSSPDGQSTISPDPTGL